MPSISSPLLIISNDLLSGNSGRGALDEFGDIDKLTTYNGKPIKYISFNIKANNVTDDKTSKPRIKVLISDEKGGSQAVGGNAGKWPNNRGDGYDIEHYLKAGTVRSVREETKKGNYSDTVTLEFQHEMLHVLGVYDAKNNDNSAKKVSKEVGANSIMAYPTNPKAQLTPIDATKLHTAIATQTTQWYDVSKTNATDKTKVSNPKTLDIYAKGVKSREYLYTIVYK